MAHRNKSLIVFTISITVIIISVATIVKVYNNHIEAQYKVLEGTIEYNAKRCFLEGICSGNEVTLASLIANGYLDKQIDPITKEYVDENKVVTFDGEKCKIVIEHN